MSESSEVVDGGTSALAVVAPDILVASAPVEEGRGGTTPEDAPQRINSQVSSPLSKEGGIYGSDNMNELTGREIS